LAIFGFTVLRRSPARAALTPLIRRTQPYTKRIAHRGIWVEPELLAEIECRAKSAEGKVRHPIFSRAWRRISENHHLGIYRYLRTGWRLRAHEPPTPMLPKPGSRKPIQRAWPLRVRRARPRVKMAPAQKRRGHQSIPF